MKRLLVTAVLSCLCAQVFAQNIVNPDNTVTFRYRNDNAKSVQVDVQFAGRQDMTKGEDGIWTVTLGPAAPDLYPYCFVVDGISVMDPLCQEYFPNETFKNSLLNLNAGAPMLHDVQDVPHGTVDYVNYYSGTMGLHGRAIVYTPPFYEQHPEKRYPVMYLISGTTDTEEVYFKVGKMNLILDNLIAQGAAKEMIIVLPYGNPSMYFPSGTNTFAMGDMFGGDMVNDLMPFVDANYRTIPDRDHRGVGGFSRGGNQGLAVGLTNLDKFSWLCSYSSFTSMALPGVYDDADRLNSQIHLFWLGVGNDDFLYGNARDYMDFLDSKGINNIKLFTDGKFGHTWMNARHFLDKTFRLLFADEPVAYPPIEAPKPVKAEKAPAMMTAPASEQRLTPEVMARLFPAPLISPQYGSDGSVTLRFRAADAGKVELESEMSASPVLMSRDDRGVWSVTMTPEKADVYRYCFVVDGTRVADPANMFLSPDNGFKYSLVDIPSAEPQLKDVQKVAHGKVSYRYCGNESVCIYTPSGYSSEEKLPVIFLAFGKGDTYESWFKLGKADNIMDNLIASGQSGRAVVVMSCSKEVRKFVKANYNCGKLITDKYASRRHSWIQNRSHFEECLKTKWSRKTK